MKNRRRYFAVKKTSKVGKLSLILAAVSAAAFAFCAAASTVMRGAAASYVGAVGLAAALLALYGCILGMRELSSAEKSYKKPYVGAIASGIMFIVWLAVFFTGIKA